jgi:fibronectin type 3 domain-containing protein
MQQCKHLTIKYWLIICSVILIALISKAKADEVYNGFYYTISDNEVTITYVVDDSIIEVIIPDTIEGLPVTSIGRGAFIECYSLTSITIPNSVTSIGKDAFYECRGLTSITIPETVTSIGDYAFYNCKSLASITIPDSVTSIGDYAFDACSSLTSITIPDSVTSIGNSAFAYCKSLTSITIPASVISIGDSAFISCSSLTSITIPDSVTSIGNSAFDNCKSLASITIPDSVTSIGNYAFDNCKSLASITIPDSVTSIGNSAFAYCKSLASITIPASVTSIGDRAFYRCYSLINITIPDTVTSIGDRAFANCYSLKSITIPTSVVSISSGAFTDSGIIYAIILSADTEIVDDAFGDDVNFIYAYQHNFNKGDVIAPTDTSIGYTIYTCSDCDLTYHSDYVNQINVCYVSHYGTVTITGLADNSITDLVIPGTIDGLPVTSIGGYAFEGCTGLISITIPDSVTSIGDGAFEDCYSLKSITIPDTVTSIGHGVFIYCTSLTNITIPNSVTSIGNSAFAWCTSLTSIIMPESVTNIGDLAFEDCTSLTNITIPETVTSIGDSAFYKCKSLASITIPDSVTSIGDYAFAWCTSLTDITIPESVTTIASKAFSYSGVIYAIILSPNTEIANYAFDDDVKVIYAYKHNFNEGEVVAPTDEGEGYTLYTCLDCALIYKSNYVKPLDYDDENSSNVNNEDDNNSGYYYHNAEGCACWIVEIEGLMEKVESSNSDYAAEYSVKDTTLQKQELAKSAGINVSNVTLIVDGEIYAENIDFYFGDLEGNGDLWIEIRNEYGTITSGYEDLNAADTIEVQFTISGIPTGTYDAFMYFIDGNWWYTNVAYGIQQSDNISDYTSIVTTDGTYKVGIKLKKSKHEYTTAIETVLPTSSTEGYTTYYCRHCEHTIRDNFIEPLDGHTHTIVTDKAVAATCTKTGLTAGTHCSVYNEVLTAQKTVAALGHNYTSKVTKATYTAKGYTTYTCSRCGDSYKSNYTNMITLTKPTVKVANTSTGVQVTWSKTTGATGYIVYRKTGSEKWTALKTITSGSTVSYVDTTAKAGTTYYYTVRAYAGSTTTNKSSYVTDVSIKYLAQPTVTLTNTSTGVKISWTKSTGAGGYYVYRKAPGDKKWILINKASNLSYTDTAAKAGTTYYYTVKAYSGKTYSSYVTDKTIKRLTQPVVTLSNVTKGVKISWKKITGAGGYYVYRKAPGDKKWTLINKASNLSYTDTTAKAGTTYYYTVKAYSGKTYSSYVTDKTIKRLTQPTVTLSNVTKGVKISWKKITGATGYIVYRKTASGSWSRIKTITSASTLSYTDTTGKNGTTYYYTVKAYSGNINSSYVTNKSIKYKK